MDTTLSFNDDSEINNSYSLSSTERTIQCVTLEFLLLFRTAAFTSRHTELTPLLRTKLQKPWAHAMTSVNKLLDALMSAPSESPSWFAFQQSFLVKCL